MIPRRLYEPLLSIRPATQLSYLGMGSFGKTLNLSMGQLLIRRTKTKFKQANCNPLIALPAYEKDEADDIQYLVRVAQPHA